MTELVRVAALSGYIETMAGLGLDPRPLLKEQGLSADLLVNPEQLIPARAAIRLLERSAAESGCITLGLRMAEGRALANLGASSLLIAHQPTLRHALTALQEFRARINSTLVLQLEDMGEDTVLHEDFTLRRPEPLRQSSDLALGVLMRLCTEVLGKDWSPRMVCFSHQAPPAAEQPIFARVFRCPLQFDSELNGIVLRRIDLDRPNQRADDQLARHARQLLDAVMSPSQRSVTQDVDQLIRLLMPAGRASIQNCAASMGLTVRTLQRLLDADGTSFKKLLNEARMQLATQYLANPRMRITDIAEFLGYGSVGAFSRWHGRVFGAPPRTRRR
ncbi:AraC family transcriptional regulator [Novosphingobium sp. APW14]|uniref:AraC family transcriptional regulator n=1 Tax=Novosphingobium sp. APW14 TaxID=3077237 RepID=UPI0028DF6778|nr:AraC family transcriptional regulator [Novosphingobium sp. APW14]MDT9013834.1 AraC family transcriptional regulator [Novosphingobium sp. APW14]